MRRAFPQTERIVIGEEPNSTIEIQFGKSIDLTLCHTNREIDIPFFDPTEFGESLLEALDGRSRAGDDDAYPRWIFVAVGTFGPEKPRITMRSGSNSIIALYRAFCNPERRYYGNMRVEGYGNA